MGRKEAREVALHLIFEMSFHDFETDVSLADRLDEEILRSIGGDVPLYEKKIEDDQQAYIKMVVRGVAEKRDELDTCIEQYSKGWKLNRLSHMTIAILRLAIYEMRYVDDVPVGAAINEAVEMAKRYDAEDAPAFINGILGAASRGETAAKEPEASNND